MNFSFTNDFNSNYFQLTTGFSSTSPNEWTIFSLKISGIYGLKPICPGHQLELGQTENSNPRSYPVPKLRKSRTKLSVPCIRPAVFLLLSGKTTRLRFDGTI